MLGLIKGMAVARKDHSDCSGCSLCLLVCPVWRRTRDISLTPHGRAKALQNGANATDIAASVDSCTLCMACEPVCPENIGLTGLLLDLRRQLAATLPAPRAGMLETPVQPSAMPSSASTLLLPDRHLRDSTDLLLRVASLLGAGGSIPVSADDGSDIALALEAGVDLPARRLERFLDPLRRLKKVIVADGLLLRHLRGCLPGLKLLGLGEALSAVPAVRRGLRYGDLYVIESRAYHSDYERLVKYYDQLRAARGCELNLDLQRIAIPAIARGLSQRLGLIAPDDDAPQGRWLLQGRNFQRIVVESLEEGAALEKLTDIPVVHLATVAAVAKGGVLSPVRAPAGSMDEAR